MDRKCNEEDNNYETVYKKHLMEHKRKVEEIGLHSVEVKDFNRQDRTQEFYKMYERQAFKTSLVIKEGFKIHSLQIQEQDLALYCFSLLQAEAKFPIRIFTIDHKKKQSSAQDEQTRKDLWMQTQILVSSLTSNQQQRKFEIMIYNFFSGFLLKKMQQFIKDRINWNYMVKEQYSDQSVIAEFEREVVQPANAKFTSLFD